MKRYVYCTSSRSRRSNYVAASSGSLTVNVGPNVRNASFVIPVADIVSDLREFLGSALNSYGISVINVQSIKEIPNRGQILYDIRITSGGAATVAELEYLDIDGEWYCAETTQYDRSDWAQETAADLAG